MNQRVLFCGAWDEGAGYPRTRSLRMAMQAAGVEVVECRVPGMLRDKQALLRAPWRWPATLVRQARQRQQLLQALDAQLAGQRRPDVIVVPYPGHGVVRAVKQRATVPVVLDLFLSAYDTIVEDRRLVNPGSLAARWLQQVDAKACAAADLVVLDTPENACYVQALTGLPPERFAWLPVHDPDAPAQVEPWRPPIDGMVELLFFGTGVPLHGLAVLIDAIVMAPGMRLTLVGGTRAHRALAVSRLGPQLRLEPMFVDRERLAELLARCQLVAGVFGSDDPASGSKVQRVVPFKVVHALAAGRPVITADTPGIARWLEGSGAVFVTAVGDAEALAVRLRELVAAPDRLARAAEQARPTYERHFATAPLATRCRDLLLRFDPARLSGAA